MFAHEVFLRARLQREVVEHPAILRVLRRENVIPQRALVVVREVCARRNAEQSLRQLEHVVGVAGLGRILAKAIVQLAGRAKNRRRCCRR